MEDIIRDMDLMLNEHKKMFRGRCMLCLGMLNVSEPYQCDDCGFEHAKAIVSRVVNLNQVPKGTLLVTYGDEINTVYKCSECLGKLAQKNAFTRWYCAECGRGKDGDILTGARSAPEGTLLVTEGEEMPMPVTTYSIQGREGLFVAGDPK